MKIVLTVQLQQDNNSPVLTGIQTKATFTSADFDLVRSFIRGEALMNLVKLMGWIADGTVTYNSNQTVTIQNL